MKRFSIFTLWVAFLVLGTASAWALKIGDSIPMVETKMKNVDGKSLAIQSVRGSKGTLVVFSCNACPFVKAWEDRMVGLGNEFQKKGVGVIAINSNDPKRVEEDSFDMMKKRYQEKNYEFPYVMDTTSDVARKFGASRTPEAFLFNAKNELVYHGAIDDNWENAKEVDQQFLKEALTALLAGKDIKLKKTRAVGCSIKFRKGK